MADEEIHDLRSHLLSARSTPADLLFRLGLTEDAFSLHRDEILRTALWGEPHGTRALPALTEDQRQLMTLRSVEPLLMRRFEQGSMSTVQPHLEIVLPGSPEIVVSSRSAIPWMLPWTVTAGKESWRIADPAISRAVSRLAPPDGACARFLDGTSYWETKFWEDAEFWWEAIGPEISKALFPHPPDGME